MIEIMHEQRVKLVRNPLWIHFILLFSSACPTLIQLSIYDIATEKLTSAKFVF